MRFTTIAALAAALVSLAGTAPALAQSQEQIKKKCQAMYGGRTGVANADRTGVTVQQAVAKCVKAHSKKK